MSDQKPMSTHELARLLLARRDMNVVAKVEYDDDPKGDGSGIVEWHHSPVMKTLGYDSEEDAFVILLGTIFGPQHGE
jgi:hypothetical protein